MSAKHNKTRDIGAKTSNVYAKSGAQQKDKLIDELKKRIEFLEKELQSAQELCHTGTGPREGQSPGGRRAEKALSESEEKFRVLSETSPAAIFLYQGEKYIYVNPMAEALTGYSRDELLAADAWDWIHPEFKGLVKDRSIKRQAGEQLPNHYEVKYRARDGRVGWVEFTTGLIEYKGKPAGLAIALDVSKSKQAEDALRASERLLNDVFDGIQDGISVLDRNLNVVRMNHVMEELYPHAMPLVGKKCFCAYHGQDRPCEVCPSLRAMESGTVQSDVVPFHGKNEKLMGWLELFAFPLKDDDGNVTGIIEQVRDITERKRAEEALRESEEKFRVLSETAPAAIGILQGGRFQYVNQAAETVTGRDRNDLQSMDFLDLVHPDFQGHVIGLYGDWLNGRIRPARFEIKIVRRDGVERWIDISVNTIDYRARPGLIMTVNDITERKLAEEELKETKAQAELYLDLMGHDINNMNQIAMGYLELIASDPDLDPDLRSTSMTALRAVRDSSRLIANVRKLQRGRSGEYISEVYDLGNLIEEVAEQFKCFPERYIDIACCVAKGVRVQANELLQDVFVNLIGNAIKHSTGPAFINIRMASEEGKDGRQYGRVTIDDNGPGVPDGMKGQIFDRLRQGDTRAKGSGLGLYLVKTLVGSYGGKVWVEDRVKGDHTKGARFVVMLPILGQ